MSFAWHKKKKLTHGKTSSIKKQLYVGDAADDGARPIFLVCLSSQQALVGRKRAEATQQMMGWSAVGTSNATRNSLRAKWGYFPKKAALRTVKYKSVRVIKIRSTSRGRVHLSAQEGERKREREILFLYIVLYKL